jgi:hypothetical protein
VGVDPGNTVGIAILSMKGNTINITSIREAKRSDLIKHIINFGKPVIIASDVNPLPKTIDRLAAALGSKTFYPEVSLTNEEKEKIIDDFKEQIKNSHQKDALAAGLKAFKNYHGLFLKVEETLGKKGREDIFEEVITELLEGKGQNIADVVKKVAKRKKK